MKRENIYGPGSSATSRFRCVTALQGSVILFSIAAISAVISIRPKLNDFLKKNIKKGNDLLGKYLVNAIGFSNLHLNDKPHFPDGICLLSYYPYIRLAGGPTHLGLRLSLLAFMGLRFSFAHNSPNFSPFNSNVLWA